MWFEENQDGGLLICRIELNERGGFSFRTEQIFVQKCHELNEDRFNAIPRIASLIANEMDSEEGNQTVSFSGFNRNGNISPADIICGGPREPELIHIMVEGKEIEQAVKGRPTKIFIRTNVESKERFKEVLRKIGKM